MSSEPCAVAWMACSRLGAWAYLIDLIGAVGQGRGGLGVAGAVVGQRVGCRAVVVQNREAHGRAYAVLLRQADPIVVHWLVCGQQHVQPALTKLEVPSIGGGYPLQTEPEPER